MRARILALLLVISILPSSGEMLELVVHWVEYGDLAHADQDRHDSSPLGADEHGCSGTFHLCGCHSANLIASMVATGICSFSSLDPGACHQPVTSHGVGAMAPPIRPPIV